MRKPQVRWTLDLIEERSERDSKDPQGVLPIRFLLRSSNTVLRISSICVENGALTRI
jgi:hypothetical protein